MTAAVAAPSAAPNYARLLEEARAFAAERHYGAALKAFDNALASHPNDTDALVSRAAVLHAWGRSREALEGYLRATTQGDVSPEVMLALGWLFMQAGRLGDAEAWMRRGLAAEPEKLAPHRGLSQVLMAGQRTVEAFAVCEEALKLFPKDVQSLAVCAECKLRQDEPAAAEPYLRRALDVEPANAALWTNLSACLRSQHRTAEALEALERAQRTAPGNDDSFVSIAACWRVLDRLDQVLTTCERNVPEHPNVDGHRLYGHALLCAGRLVEGWHHNEFRWLREPFLTLRKAVRGLPWRGQDLAGKTIVLHVEQGFGDAIQFVRYVPHVKALGATVLLSVFPEVERLFATCPGVDGVVVRGKASPPCDYYAHLLGLPRIFGTDLGSIPNDIPYLQADPERAANWAARLGAAQAELRVGLVWAGNPKQARDRDRSIPLDTLAPLLRTLGVKFFSLQKGSAALSDNVSHGGHVVDLAPELKDFADTAAVISPLDLVISVCTATAHLAGALGKRVWVPLHKDPDWRWMEKREDTPWYPTMRLFRQHKDGDWAEVIGQLRSALVQEMQSRTFKTEPRFNTSQCEKLVPKSLLTRLSSGHRPGFSAVTEARCGIVQYFPDEPIVGDSIDWYGEYLQGQIDVLGRIVKPGTTSIEVCPGIGVHALPLAQATGPQGHLFLYESRPLMRPLLRQNLAANGIGNVTVIEGSPGASTGSEAVSTETIDDLQLRQLLLLKINLAATAQDVIAGAAETLWRLRPMLFIDTADETTLLDLISQTRDYGYRCWKFETPLFSRANFNHRPDDIFDGRTSVALLATPEEVDTEPLAQECTEL